MKVAFSKKVLLFASGVLALSILSIGIVNATGDRFGYWSQPRTSVQTIKVFSAPFTYSDILKKGGQFSLGQLPRDTQITSAFVEVATPFKTNEPNGVNISASIYISDNAPAPNNFGSLAAGGGELTKSGVTNPLIGTPAFQAVTNNSSDVVINVSASDASGEAYNRLTAGKATVYVTYLNF